MEPISATVLNGQIVPSQPIPWPEGTSVEIRVASNEEREEEWGGISEDEQVGSPEAIARWQAALDAIPPTEWTDEDQAAWARRRREDREWELAHRRERERKLGFPE
jgi:hypothetical protein